MSHNCYFLRYQKYPEFKKKKMSSSINIFCLSGFDFRKILKIHEKNWMIKEEYKVQIEDGRGAPW